MKKEAGYPLIVPRLPDQDDEDAEAKKVDLGGYEMGVRKRHPEYMEVGEAVEEDSEGIFYKGKRGGTKLVRPIYPA